METPIAVVHVYKAFPPVRGGIEGHVALLSRLLAQRGLRVDVLCARSPGTTAVEEYCGVSVRRSRALLTIASTPLPPTLPWSLKHRSADIVHLHLPWAPAEMAWLLGGRRRPLVVTIHCEVVRYRRLAWCLQPLTRAVLKHASRILVSSVALRNATVPPAYYDRVQITPYGVDLRRFKPAIGGADPIPHIKRPRIMFVGQFRPYKGLPVLAAALAQLPRAQLVIVGDGPERIPFQRALRTHGCLGRAHFMGAVDDEQLVALLQTADAAVLPSTSRAEAFGIAIAEAQACGVPAVTTDVGTGTANTVIDRVSGRVVPPGNSAALAEGLAWCLDPISSASRRMAARAHAEARLCADRMTLDVLRGYEDSMQQASR